MDILTWWVFPVRAEDPADRMKGTLRTEGSGAPDFAFPDGPLDGPGLEPVRDLAGLIGRHEPNDLVDAGGARPGVGEPGLLQPDHLPDFELVGHGVDLLHVAGRARPSGDPSAGPSAFGPYGLRSGRRGPPCAPPPAAPRFASA